MTGCEPAEVCVVVAVATRGIGDARVDGGRLACERPQKEAERTWLRVVLSCSAWQYVLS